MAEENKENKNPQPEPGKKKSLIPIIVANLIVLAIVGYFVNNAFGTTEKPPMFVPPPYAEVSLDRFTFSVPAVAGKFVDNVYQIMVNVTLNTTFDNYNSIADDLKLRKSLIRDRIYDILNKFGPEEFTEAAFIAKLKKKIKDDININIYNIKSSKEEVIKEVLIIDRVLPAVG